MFVLRTVGHETCSEHVHVKLVVCPGHDMSNTSSRKACSEYDLNTSKLIANLGEYMPRALTNHAQDMVRI